MMVSYKDIKGYNSSAYLASLDEFGNPRHLPLSDGWILKRLIKEDYYDAMGPYPLFDCNDWQLLEADLNSMCDEIVSLTVVSNPLADVKPAQLSALFPDCMRPFKSHAVVDLQLELWASVSTHHKRNIRKALKEQEIFRAEQPAQYFESWTTLYQNLVQRHQIKGIQAFSGASFARQLKLENMHLFVATSANKPIAMQMWLQDGDNVFYHLGASGAEGYKKRSAFGLMWKALLYFSSKEFKWADLGAAAGAKDEKNGLSRFKSGWGAIYKNAYLCGRILNKKTYNRLSIGHNSSNYFPAYRAGELTG